MPIPPAPMQFGRGAFTPTGLVMPAAQRPQRATVAPGKFMATADKMWKSPAARPATTPAAKPAAGPAKAAQFSPPMLGAGAMPGLHGPAAPPAPPRMPTPAGAPPKVQAPAGLPPAPPVAAPQARPAPEGGGGLLGGVHSFFRSNPAATGALLSMNPKLTTGLASATGGLGLMALVNLIQNGGADLGAFMPGADASGGTAAGP